MRSCGIHKLTAESLMVSEFMKYILYEIHKRQAKTKYFKMLSHHHLITNIIIYYHNSCVVSVLSNLEKLDCICPVGLKYSRHDWEYVAEPSLQPSGLIVIFPMWMFSIYHHHHSRANATSGEVILVPASRWPVFWAYLLGGDPWKGFSRQAGRVEC